MELASFLVLLAVCVFFGWLARRAGLPEAVGYLAGGGLLGMIELYAGPWARWEEERLELLKAIGLVLLFFSAGVTVGLERLREAGGRLLVSVLTCYTLIWVTVGVFSAVLMLDDALRAALILLALNSSTVAVLNATRSRTGPFESLALLQSALEDVVQFSAFALLVALGGATLTIPGISMQVMRVLGSAALLAAVSGIPLLVIMRKRVEVSKEGFFLFALSLALFASLLATELGLPPLFGAFIAGLMASVHPRASQIGDMAAGLREIGLLTYFALLGQSLVNMFHAAEGAYDMAVIGLVTGAFILLSRHIGITLGSLLGGNGFAGSVRVSLYLLPVSETGVILANELLVRGMLEEAHMLAVVTSATLSMALGSFLSSRAYDLSLSLSSRLPRRYHGLLDSISRVYMLDTSLAKGFLDVLARYMVTAAAVNVLATQLLRLLTAPYARVFLGVFATIVQALLLLMAYRFLLRGVLRAARPRPLARRLELVVAILTGVFALLLQVQIAVETMVLAGPLAPAALMWTATLLLLLAFGLTVYEVLIVRLGSREGSTG